MTAVQTDGGYDYGLTEECGKCIEVVCVDGPTRGFEWSELEVGRVSRTSGEIRSREDNGFVSVQSPERRE